MNLITVDGLDLPETIGSLEGFRQWAGSLTEPAPRVHFSRGRVHIEMSPQNYRTHAPVVTAINHVLLGLATERSLGRYFVPPSWITDEPSGLSTEPDGFLVTWASFATGRVRLNPARDSELLGRPDMALEVVSRTSAAKDTEELVTDYARAGVPEYWLVDARSVDIVFRLHVLAADGTYTVERAQADGWVASPTWGRSFRLVRFTDQAGLPDFRLEVRGA